MKLLNDEWTMTIDSSPSEMLYDARTMDEVREEHKMAVTLLMAALPMDDLRKVKVPGVGSARNHLRLGPMIWLYDK